MFNPKWRFDFKISFDNHVVLLAPGKQISIRVKVEKIRGGRQPVMLDVNTNWESMGLTAWINPPSIVPTPEWTATMMVRASANTPPGSYLFTVRGGAKGTFNTSEDAVTVVVDPRAEQKSDKQDNYQPQQSSDTVEPNFSLDNLFQAKNEEKVSPIENKSTKSSNASWAGISIFIGFVIGIIIVISVIRGGGGGGGSNCPIISDCGPVGVTVAPQCKCPSACPKYFIITNPPSMNGYKQCHR